MNVSISVIEPGKPGIEDQMQFRLRHAGVLEQGSSIIFQGQGNWLSGETWKLVRLQ